MATASRTIAVRLTLEEADQFRAALKTAGTDGEAALKRIGDAARKSGQDVKDSTEPVKLASYQINILAAETHKFVDQILAGGSAFKAFAFQAPNAVATVGGFGNALKLVGSLFTPFRVGALLAAGGVTAMVVAAEAADARIVKLRNSLVGYSNDYAALASRIEASSRKQGGQLGVPTSDVRSAQVAVVQAIPGLSDADVQKSVELGQKLALTIDHDIGAAIQHLGQIARDPAAAIKALAEQGLPGLSASLLSQIDLMQRSGDRTGAYKLALQALLTSLGGAQMTAAQKATASLTAEWEKLWHGIEEGLAGPGARLTTWLADNLKQINAIRDKGGFMPAEPVIQPWMNGNASPGNPLAGNTPSSTTFAAVYGPPIAAHAAARGYSPEMALALAALESRQGTQVSGGLNNPFNITAASGESSTQGYDNANHRPYNFRNFNSIGEAAQTFFDKLERQWPGVKAAGSDPDKIAAALRVGEPGGYAEGPVGLTVEQKKQAYADALRGQMRALPAVPTNVVPFDVSGRRRDIDGPAPNAPPQLTPEYIRAADAARQTLEGRRQSLSADIKGTETALGTARANNDQGAVDLLTSRLRDQRAELEKLRSPVEEFIKAQRDQSDAAKDASGSAGEVGKALADLDRVARDSGWAVTEAQRAEVVSLTLARLSAGYKKQQDDIARSTSLTIAQAHGWDQSNEAGRQLEAQQKAITDARQFFKAGTPDFEAAVKAGTKAYLDQASAAAALASATKLVQDRHDAETLSLQIGLAKRGAGSDDQARALADLRARQGLETVTDPQTREAVMASSRGVEELRLKYQSITANTNELQNFASSAFDRIGSDITAAFTQGTSAAEAFGNIGKAVISELIQEGVKLSLLNPLKNWINGKDSNLPTASGVFERLLGIAGGASGGGTGWPSGAGIEPTAFEGFINHSGGIAGLEYDGKRRLPSSAWDGARRLHGGGVAGLAGDEVPAVLRAGEGVFTKGQMKALGASAGGGPAIQADFHYHAASGGDGKVPSDEELERASKTWSREQERNIMAIMARERGRPGGVLWR